MRREEGEVEGRVEMERERERMLKESRERTEELVVRVRAEKNGRGSPGGRRRMVERVHELERAVVVLTRNRDEWREHSESTPGSFAEVERCREMVGRLERQVRVATRDALMARDASWRLTEEVLVLRRGRGGSGSEGIWIGNGGGSAPPQPPPPLEEMDEGAKERRLLEEEFGRLNAQLAQALEVIWLCVGRESVESALSEKDVKRTLVEFQKVKDRSKERR